MLPRGFRTHNHRIEARTLSQVDHRGNFLERVIEVIIHAHRFLLMNACWWMHLNNEVSCNDLLLKRTA